MSFTSDRSRWSDVAAVAVAQLLGAMGTFLVMVTLVLSFQQRGAQGWEVAALVVCEALPMVVLGKPIGLLVDRADSRLLLVLTGLAQAGACLVLAGVSGLPAILGTVAALSAATAIAQPTRSALIPVMVLRDDLPKASALGQTALSLGMMGGPALAGFLFGGVGPQWTVRYAAIGGLAAVVTAFAIRTRRGGAARAATGPTSAATSAAASAATAPATTAATTAATTVDEAGRWRLGFDRLLWVCIWGLAAVSGVVAAINVVIVFFVMGTLHSTPQAYGVIDASWMVGMLVGAWVAGITVRPGTTDHALARRLVFATGLVCTAIVAVGGMVGPWWIVPCYLAGGIANAAISVFGSTLLGRRVPPAARGRAGTAATMRVQGLSLLGYLAGGLLLAAGEPRWILLGCGAAGLLTTFVVLRVVNRASAGTGGAAAAPQAQATAVA